MFRIILFFSMLIVVATSCRSQTEKEVQDLRLGGPCEGCEAIYEYGDEKWNPIDTLPGFQDNEPKLKLSGIVYEEDGKTPAKGVILYIYHTDRDGIYPTQRKRRRLGQKAWIYQGVDHDRRFRGIHLLYFPSRLLSQ